MKSKIRKLKFLKDPDSLLCKPDVETYIWHIESTGELGKLPLPLLCYYVVGCRLTDEVNNGGFAQYISNSSVATLPFLESCAKAIGNTELVAITTELLATITTHLGTDDIHVIKDADYSDELNASLSALDDRFYELDKKVDVSYLAKKYYQANIPQEKLVFELVKPPENERRRYFVCDAKQYTNEEAAEAFMEFLAEFKDVEFIISIERWGDAFRISASQSTYAFDLAEIFANFDNEHYSFSGAEGVHDRLRMLGFKLGGGIFKEIHIDSHCEERWIWRLTIAESGFDKNEYEISYCRFCSCNSGRQASRISVGDFSCDKVDLDSIEKVLVKCAKEHGNIIRIYRQGDFEVLFDEE